jgi:hypothetical protein
LHQKNKHKHRLKPADAVVDAVADANAEEETIRQLKLKWEVVVVDVGRASLDVVLESTLADTAGEFLVNYGR